MYQSKKFHNNSTLLEAINKAKKRNKPLHVMGLLSDGGINIGMPLIDDNPKNIEDVNNLRDRNFNAIHFTREIDITMLLQENLIRDNFYYIYNKKMPRKVNKKVSPKRA